MFSRVTLFFSICSVTKPPCTHPNLFQSLYNTQNVGTTSYERQIDAECDAYTGLHIQELEFINYLFFYIFYNLKSRSSKQKNPSKEIQSRQKQQTYCFRAASRRSLSACFCRRFSTVAERKFSRDSRRSGSSRDLATSQRSSRYSWLCEENEEILFMSFYHSLINLY